MPRRRSSLYWLRIIDRTVPILLPVLVAVVGAGWTAYQFLEAQTKEARIRIEASEAEAKRQAADSERFRIARRIEAQQPFLEKQLALYIKAMETVGIFVTDPDSSQRAEAKRTFERLFWSELPMVEQYAKRHREVGSGRDAAAFVLSCACHPRFNPKLLGHLIWENGRRSTTGTPSEQCNTGRIESKTDSERRRSSSRGSAAYCRQRACVQMQRSG
jgi:hypothetical protein